MFFVNINVLEKLLRFLQRDISSNRIAFGIVLGAVLGLVPSLFIKFVVLILILALPVNLVYSAISAALFSVIFFFAVPLFNNIGFFILNVQFFMPLWRFFYNAAILPFIGLNNTVIMGSVTFLAVLLLPIFFVSKKIVAYYNNNWHDKVIKQIMVKRLVIRNISSASNDASGVVVKGQYRKDNFKSKPNGEKFECQNDKTKKI
jgi:uncharacterized protein (TIGR03546 family)